jgi:hypothetical protein
VLGLAENVWGWDLEWYFGAAGSVEIPKLRGISGCYEAGMLFSLLILLRFGYFLIESVGVEHSSALIKARH